MFLGDHPLIAYAINAAKKAQTVTDVVVSTDDELIAAFAVVYGAKVVARPERLSGDDTTSEEVIVDWLDGVGVKDAPDIIAFLQCTAPLMLAKDIDECVGFIGESDARSACCCVAPFDGIIWNQGNMPNGLRMPRQLVDSRWIEAGSVYAFKTSHFLNMDEPSRFCHKAATHKIPASRCFEIDTLQDFKICEYLLQNRGLCEDMEVEDGLF